jgi:NAD(P)-dependent dehydrogenase (short-subunit alcohol dehydrogenase family)
MTGDFQGKVALVTGAGGGFGLATARAFARAGATIILVDRNKELIGAAVEELRRGDSTATGLVCDVSDAAQVRESFAQALAEHGRLDCI